MQLLAIQPVEPLELASERVRATVCTAMALEDFLSAEVPDDGPGEPATMALAICLSYGRWSTAGGERAGRPASARAATGVAALRRATNMAAPVAGWEATVVSATGVTILVEFVRAVDSSGRPYHNERLPYHLVQPL